jgi:hypothetical protein
MLESKRDAQEINFHIILPIFALQGTAEVCIFDV